jgi:GAF domain-containing protein
MAEHRQLTRLEWLDAASAVIGQLLTDPERNPLHLVAGALRLAVDADCVVVLTARGDRDDPHTLLAVGPRADEIAALLLTTAPELPLHVLRSGEPLHVHDSHDAGPWTPHLHLHEQADSVLLVPLPDSHGNCGVLAAVRSAGRSQFTSRDLEMAAAFAHQAGSLVELSATNQARQRAVAGDSRVQIAGDLHRWISHRLFSISLALSGAASDLKAGPHFDRVIAAIADLDEVIRHVRASALAAETSLDHR